MAQSIQFRTTSIRIIFWRMWIRLSDQQAKTELPEKNVRKLISERMCYRLRKTGAQPDRLYAFAKVHKIGTPLKPVLSIPVSSYHNFKKFRTPLFEKLPGANIKISTLDARKKNELICFGRDRTN